jgi:FkbM family methyltransferase
MGKLANNFATAVRNPEIAFEYAGWVIRSFISKDGPVRMLHGVRLGDFSGFSEYHSAARFMGQTDITFLTRYEFGPGNIVDIGANLGVVSLALAARYPDRLIFAIEPNPSTFNALKANISRNQAGNIRPFDLAVNDTDGEVMFDANPTDRGTAALSIGSSTHSVKVISKTMDAIARDANLNQIGLLKVDVEGFEAAVFAGAARVLQQVRPSVIFFEVCPSLTAARGFDPAAPARKLVDSRYRLFRVGPDAALIPAEIAGVVDVTLENWVALPE